MTTQMDEASRRRNEGQGGGQGSALPNFAQLQSQGMARPPRQQQPNNGASDMGSGWGQNSTRGQPGWGSTDHVYDVGSWGAGGPGDAAMQRQGGGSPGQPNLQGGWQSLIQQGQNAPHINAGPQSNYHPGGYRGPGQLDAFTSSHFAQPQVQAQGHFRAPAQGQQVDQRTGQAVMQALGNPSRYGSREAANTYDIFNRQLTQQGNADRQRIDEDMAARGIYASTTAGGRMGDLATNLGQQRADFATNLATDQARQYQGDRASAIQQALGYGGQQFGQGLQGFEANQAAGQQRFGQQLASSEFGLNQNQQNFGQQLQQHGANQQEGLNRFNSGMDQAQFGLAQNQQNFGQRFNTFGANQAAQQQGFNQQYLGQQGLQNYGQSQFNNQLATAGFNADQDYRNTDMYLRMLGMT